MYAKARRKTNASKWKRRGKIGTQTNKQTEKIHKKVQSNMELEVGKEKKEKQKDKKHGGEKNTFCLLKRECEEKKIRYKFAGLRFFRIQ